MCIRDSYTMAYIFKGRVQALKDEEAKTDAAKWAFEKAISLIKPDEKTGNFKSYWIEAHEYLGYYFEKTGNPSNEKAERYLNPKKPAAPKK